ncbi:MAG: SulP family inorganic anion transporter [Opitutales bacterium]
MASDRIAGLREFLTRRPFSFFPLPRHLRGYSRASLQGDAVAGLNVALLAFPQGMAYALIAGLPIEYGIYGGAVAALLGGLFAGSRFITLGPTNATSVMLASAFAAAGIAEPELRATFLPLLLLMVGALLVAGAFLRLANVIQYISQTVVTGYITAAALLIIAGQAPKMLGITLDPGASTFIEKVIAIGQNLGHSQVEPMTVAAVTAIVFYGLKILPATRRWPNVALTLIIVSALTAWGATSIDLAFFQWTNLPLLDSINPTEWPVGAEIRFENARQLANAALAVALLCVLEGTSIGKNLAARSGERLDSDQEMYAIGMANLGSAFLGGMPASGSLTRSKLSWSSGGRTPAASLISGVIVAAGAFLVGEYIRFIPMTVLATLVVTIGISLYDKRAITVVTSSTGSDRLVFWVTFVSGLVLALDTAIYIGAGLSIILFLRKAAAPELVEYGISGEGELSERGQGVERASPEVSIIHAEGDLFFGSAEMFRDQMRRVSDEANLKIVICKLRNARHLDATTVMALEELVKYMNEQGRYLILSEVRPGVMRVLRQSRLLDFLNGPGGEPFVFEDTPENPPLSTAQALRRAQELLGHQEANIRIYVKPTPAQPDETAENARS